MRKKEKENVCVCEEEREITAGVSFHKKAENLRITFPAFSLIRYKRKKERERKREKRVEEKGSKPKRG